MRRRELVDVKPQIGGETVSDQILVCIRSKVASTLKAVRHKGDRVGWARIGQLHRWQWATSPRQATSHEMIYVYAIRAGSEH